MCSITIIISGILVFDRYLSGHPGESGHLLTILSGRMGLCFFGGLWRSPPDILTRNSGFRLRSSLTLGLATWDATIKLELKVSASKSGDSWRGAFQPTHCACFVDPHAAKAVRCSTDTIGPHHFFKWPKLLPRNIIKQSTLYFISQAMVIYSRGNSLCCLKKANEDNFPYEPLCWWWSLPGQDECNV